MFECLEDAKIFTENKNSKTEGYKKLTSFYNSL